MPMTIVRFNQVQPGLDPKEMSARYQATLDMAQYADEHGFSMVSLEEHHGADNGWSPSPLVTAGMVLAVGIVSYVFILGRLEPIADPPPA